MDKITVVCHKDHVVGYEDYAGKCLLCEVERLQKRDSSSWVGLTHREMQELMAIRFIDDAVLATEAKLKEKNT